LFSPSGTPNIKKPLFAFRKKKTFLKNARANRVIQVYLLTRPRWTRRRHALTSSSS
jgi:hypothetical protein